MKNNQVSKHTNDILLISDKQSFLQRIKGLVREYGYLMLSFLIPAVLMYLIYAAMEIHPIGEGSVLVLDLNGQYVSFFEGLRHAIYGDASFLYSFSRALGGEFMGMYAYYLASPFSYIVALFPQGMILEALLTIFLIKTGLCGFTFGFYLHKTSFFKKTFNRPTVIAFSIMYALSAYCVVQQHNSMWIDAVIWLPLIAYGIEELIKKGHYKVYVIFLSLTILSNFYIGYMCCIFCVVYFFAYYFAHNENSRNNPYKEKAHFPKTFLRMFLFSLLAVAIAAIIILTAYYSLTFGKTAFSNTVWTLKTNFDVLDVFTKLLPCSYDTVRPEGLPFIYCGVLTLLLIPIYFCSTGYSTREKILYGVLIAFFFLSFVINPVDLVWHGFQRPNWLNYRYSFMLCFLLLTIGYKGITEIKRVRIAPLVFSSAMIILFTGIAQKFEFSTFVLGSASHHRNHSVGKLLTIECIWFTIVLVGIYLLVLCVMRKVKKIQNVALILAILVSIEAFCNGLSNCVDLGADVVYTSYTTYHKNMDPLHATTAVIKDNDKSFYRFEEVYHKKANDNIALNIHGLTNSTSTLNATTINLIKNMGYVGKSHESRYYAANLVADSLLGVKYVLTGQGDVATEFRNDKALLADEKYYEQYYSDEQNTVYRNPYALSLAYAVNSKVSDIDLGNYRNPYERLNAIVTAMLGEDEIIEVFRPLNDVEISTSNISTSKSTPTKSSNYKYPFTAYSKLQADMSSSVKFKLSIPYVYTDEATQAAIAEQRALENEYGYVDGEEMDDEEDDSDKILPESLYVYFYLPSEFHRGFNFSPPSGSYGTCFGGSDQRILFCGSLNEGEAHTISLTLESDNLYVTNDVPLFYYIDYEVYSNAMERLSKTQLIIEEGFTDDHLTGSIETTENNSTIFTSIPYDQGWIVKVDGQRVDTFGIFSDSTFKNKDKTEGSLIAFNIENSGEHKVELIYRPKAFVIGLTISIIGLIVFILIMIFEKALNKLFSKILMPITIPPISEYDIIDESEFTKSSDKCLLESPPLNDCLTPAEDAIEIAAKPDAPSYKNATTNKNDRGK